MIVKVSYKFCSYRQVSEKTADFPNSVKQSDSTKKQFCWPSFFFIQP